MMSVDNGWMDGWFNPQPQSDWKRCVSCAVRYVVVVRSTRVSKASPKTESIEGNGKPVMDCFWLATVPNFCRKESLQLCLSKKENGRYRT
mmetsp:Transcript_19874/g.46376  ORF Transcript_19874/g.46376 Transcript_19874/m.46376 type:complete len:90 (-) Transcript_19874:81-350(-)